MKPWAARVVDFLVPFGMLIREAEHRPLFDRWPEIIWRFLPHTFFVFWLFSYVPLIGSFIYMLVLVPLSAWRYQTERGTALEKQEMAATLLLYFTVILIGFGSVWAFVGHFFIADQIARGIGWEAGSPFQTELAFYTLGTGVAALLAVWLRGHLITAVVISKSIFWYGAAYVHIHDAIVNANYAPLNIGRPLIGDIIYPTLLLALLAISWKAPGEPRPEQA